MKGEISEEVRQLEILLARRRRLGGRLLEADTFDQRGPREGPDRDAMMARADQDEAEHLAVSKELEALVARLRREAPEAVRRWAEAHLTLLAEFIQQREGAPDGSHDSIAISVAHREQEGWAEVWHFMRLYVDENFYYVRLDPARYRELLGLPP